MADEAPKTAVKRLDFGKRAPLTNPIDQAAEDAIDESIAPLAPSNILGTMADDVTEDEVTTDDAQTGDFGAALEAEVTAEAELADTLDDAVEGVEEAVQEELSDVAPVEAPVEEPATEPETIVESGMTETDVYGTNFDVPDEPEKAEPEVEAAPTETAEEPAEAEAEVDSIAKLEADKAALEDQIESRKEAEKKHVCGEIVKVMTQYGVDIDYLAAFIGVKYKRRGSKAKPKYKDPMTGKTWSGRGKTPVWIRGKDFKKFLI